MKKEIGFGTVGIALVAVAVVLLGFIDWRLYDANKNNQTNSTNQTSNNKSEQSTNPPQAKPVEQADPNEGYVVIKEWGVRFKPVEALGGVQYFKPSGIEGNAVTFTTSEMASAAAACSPASGQIVLGLLTRSTETVPGNGGMVAAIDGYTYQYRAPQATCGAGDALEGQAVPNISASLKSLEAVK